MIWSATYKCYLEPLRKLQNKTMRVINNMQWSSNADPLFRKNKILKLEDLVKLETSKLIFNFDRCKLPNSFTKYFQKISQNHSRVTRSSDNNMLYLPRYRTNRLQRSLKYRGVKICNDAPFNLKKIATLYIILIVCTNDIS